MKLMLNLTIWVALTSAAFAIGETPRATPGPTTPPARNGTEVTPKNLARDLNAAHAPSKETKK